MKSLEERIASLGAKIKASKLAARRSIRLLDSNFLLPPGPNLVMAPTGKGKTSFFANLVLTALQNTTGYVVCLLNEETEDDFFSRLAGIQMGIGFHDIKFNRITEADVTRMYDRIKALMVRVVVVDTEEWNLNCLEDVLSVIKEHSHNPATTAVFLDYLQNITESRNPELVNEPAFMLSKKLGSELKDIGKRALCPIVVTAQIHPGPTDVLTRVQNDKTFANHCKTAIELKSDFSASTTDMFVAKDRFNNMTGKTFRYKYELGRLSYLHEVILQPSEENT